MDLTQLRDILMIGAVLFSAASTIGVMKWMLKEHDNKFIEQEKQMEVNQKRLNKHGDDLVRLNTKAESAVTSEDVALKFVSRELFDVHREGLDKQLEAINKTQSEILSIVRGNHNG